MVLTMISLLQFLVYYTIILNSLNFTVSDIIQTCIGKREDAFQSTWSILKSKIPIEIGQKRIKRKGLSHLMTSSSTTERSYLEIPILPVPKSRYQDLYRMDAPPARLNLARVKRVDLEKEEPLRKEKPSQKTKDDSKNSAFLLDFKRFRIKFFYNVISV